MFHVPSVDEWWKLTRKYKQFSTPSNLTLKEYGYMKIFDLIEERCPKRIIEFGHGFNNSLFAHCEERNIEIWGIDNHMNLPYFPDRDKWMAIYENELVNVYKNSRFILGQLGADDEVASNLPNGYFDMVISVSVLEEIGDASILTKIARHSNQILSDNGVFVNTHDINYGDVHRLRFYFECLKSAGFYVGDIDHEIQQIFNIPINETLLENPTQAMTWYNSGEEDRVYSGHWTTLFHVSDRIPH